MRTARARSSSEERLAYWLMVLPAALIYLLVMAFPTAMSLVLSVSDFSGGSMFDRAANPWGFAGFGRYAELFADPQFWVSLKNNVYIILVSVFGQIPLGFLFAYLIFRRLVRAPSFWQGILYLPAIISTIVIGSLWGALFSPYGPIAEAANRLYLADFASRLRAIMEAAPAFPPPAAVIERIVALAGGNDALRTAGLGGAADVADFLSGYSPAELKIAVGDLANLFAPRYNAAYMDKSDIAMLPVLFVILWQWTGFYLIIFLANMQRIDTQIIEAARIDGAKEFQVLARIVLPSQSPVVVTAAIFAIAGSLRSFDVIWAMNGEKLATQVLSIYTYRKAFAASPDYPLANAVSMVMVLVSLALIAVTRAVEKRTGGKE